MTNQATVTYFAFALLKVESRRTSSAVLTARCSPTCSVSLILLPFSLLLLSSCVTELRAVFLVQLLATGSRSTMNPADHDEVVSQFCAMTRARPDEVGILSQIQKILLTQIGARISSNQRLGSRGRSYRVLCGAGRERGASWTTRPTGGRILILHTSRILHLPQTASEEVRNVG